jgi:hypothetical protein
VPVLPRLHEGIAPGCYRLSDVARDHFKRSEYYVSFYQHARLEDELNYAIAMGPS